MPIKTGSDGEILKGDSVIVTLGKRRYKCAEPVRFIGRQMLALILDGDELRAAGGKGNAVRMLNIAFELLCLFPMIGRDREYLENDATEEEIGKAFEAVREMVTRPFVQSGAISETPDAPETVNTTNLPSTSK